METFLIVCGAIVTIAGAINAVNKHIVQPINLINNKLEQVDRIENGQKQLMKAQAQTMEHIISGNNIEELKAEYRNLIEYCISN